MRKMDAGDRRWWDLSPQRDINQIQAPAIALSQLQTRLTLACLWRTGQITQSVITGWSAAEALVHTLTRWSAPYSGKRALRNISSRLRLTFWRTAGLTADDRTETCSLSSSLNSHASEIACFSLTRGVCSLLLRCPRSTYVLCRGSCSVCKYNPVCRTNLRLLFKSLWHEPFIFCLHFF